MKPQALFRILTILREESDEQHRLSQQALLERMETRFGVKLNRRTLKTYLDALIEAGYPLYATKVQRRQGDGTEEILMTDWYLEPLFEISELRLLCDMLAAMPAVPEIQRDLLMRKLMRFAPPSFRDNPSHQITYLHTPPAKQLLFSVDLLCEAMRCNCMVRFRYGSYQLGENGEPVLVPRCHADQTVREYVVSPYEIVVSHGHYYLICCKEPYRALSNYRIDRMTEMHLLEDFERLPLSEVSGQGAGHPTMLAEQLYMYSGEEIEIQFLADNAILSDLLDWFGSEIRIAPAEHHSTLHCTVRVNPTAMQHWALQYAKYVTVLSPESFRDELAATAADFCRRLNTY